MEGKIVYSNKQAGFVIVQFEREDQWVDRIDVLEEYAVASTPNFVKVGVRFNDDWKATSGWDAWPDIGYTIEIGNIQGVWATSYSDTVCVVATVTDIMPGLVGASSFTSEATTATTVS